MPTQKNGEVAFHYFDVLGIGEAVNFDEWKDGKSTEQKPQHNTAAKDLNP